MTLIQIVKFSHGIVVGSMILCVFIFVHAGEVVVKCSQTGRKIGFKKGLHFYS